MYLLKGALMATHSAQSAAKVKAARLARVRAAASISAKKPSPTNFAGVYELGPAERIALVKQGVAASEVFKVAKTIGRPKERLMKVLGLPRATVDRKAKANQHLSVEHGERLIGFSKLVGQVQVMVEQSGDPTGFDAAKWLGDWLERPLPALGGKCAAEYMDTGEGQQLVSSLLAMMQSGAYA
jgi:putative toxin-antitoxin system antitoxin component (TIGR02293 family)